MSDILEKILAYKAHEAAALDAHRTEIEAAARAQTPPRGFESALRAGIPGPLFPIIAEIKKASPSKGLIRPDFDPGAHARDYAVAGAAALSILTDAPSFQGGPADFAAARNAVDLPLLRKDFMIAPIQIAQSRAMGADAILLIMAALSDDLAHELALSARDWGMDVLAECHDRAEVERALGLPGTMIGVNNRNLRTFETHLSTTEALAPLIPADRLCVAESGLASSADCERLWRAGARAFLIGESFMRAARPGEALAEMAKRR